MSPSVKKRYLSSFNPSMNISGSNEFNFKMGIAEGRRPKQKGQMKADKCMNNYQSPTHLNTLEPLNVKKRGYMG